MAFLYKIVLNDKKNSPANQCLDVWDIAGELLLCLFSECFVLLHTK